MVENFEKVLKNLRFGFIQDKSALINVFPLMELILL